MFIRGVFRFLENRCIETSALPSLKCLIPSSFLINVFLIKKDSLYLLYFVPLCEEFELCQVSLGFAMNTGPNYYKDIGEIWQKWSLHWCILYYGRQQLSVVIVGTLSTLSTLRERIWDINEYTHAGKQPSWMDYKYK